MNAHVHYTLTRRWALDVGFDESAAEEVARWDVGTDRLFPGDRREFLPYHWSRQGADGLAERYLARAIAEADLRYLGVALHCAQDAVAHGRLNRLLHWPGIDIWRRRRAHVRQRIEDVSKELLRAYLDGGSPVSDPDDDPLPDLPPEPPVRRRPAERRPDRGSDR